MQRTTARRRGMTLTELLVASAVSVILVTAMAASFVQILRASEQAQAQARAHNSARAAVERMTREMRTLRLDASAEQQQFLLVDRPLTHGDWLDNDGDTFVDEEIFDGFDTDGDWAIGSDRHGVIGATRERVHFVGVADQGDAGVDEDCVFSADEVAFIVPGTPRLRVSYRIGTFEGQDNVLLRGVVTNPAPVAPFGDEVVEPVVFDAVSLDILAWNPNNDAVGPAASRPYWVSEWDATTKLPPLRPLLAPAGVPPFKLPGALLIGVTVGAEPHPLATLGTWQDRPLQTARVQTVVTVESVAQDNRYFRFVRD